MRTKSKNALPASPVIERSGIVTATELVAYLEGQGLNAEVKDGTVSVVLGTSGPMRFRFSMKDFGAHGEGFAQETRQFADELNDSLIYAVKVQELTGMTPSELSELPSETFAQINNSGAMAKAKEHTNGVVASAKKLAKSARSLSERLGASKASQASS